MKKSLIQLIKESNVIIISGSEQEEGENFLMNKLYHSNKILGTRERLTNTLYSADNIFVDGWNFLHEKHKGWLLREIAIAKHTNKKFFLNAIQSIDPYTEKLQELGNLYIQIHNIDRQKNKLNITIKTLEREKRKAFISLTNDDFIKLDQWNEEQRVKTIDKMTNLISKLSEEEIKQF